MKTKRYRLRFKCKICGKYNHILTRLINGRAEEVFKSSITKTYQEITKRKDE